MNLFYHYLLTIVDIETLRGGHTIEALAVEGVPRAAVLKVL